jgi:hypothetical protein
MFAVEALGARRTLQLTKRWMSPWRQAYRGIPPYRRALGRLDRTAREKSPKGNTARIAEVFEHPEACYRHVNCAC